MPSVENFIAVEYIDNPGHWRATVRTSHVYSHIVETLATSKLKREVVSAANAKAETSGLQVRVIR